LAHLSSTASVGDSIVDHRAFLMMKDAEPQLWQAKRLCSITWRRHRARSPEGYIPADYTLLHYSGRENRILLHYYFLEGGVMERCILFVEDDANFRELFTRLMREALAPERLDVAFVEAGTLAEARTRLREGGLDAALIDVTMPDGDGLELVGEIHDGGLGRPIPTLVLTASLETSVAGRAMEAGAKGALSKVVSIPETVKAIERLFDAPIEGQR
jgi:CheY-like chemotaxis protein